MKHVLLILTLIVGSATFVNAQFDRDIQFGNDTTFEVATWNIEHFPKNGQTTIDYVINLVEMMDVDFFGMQEIEDEAAFNDVVDGLPGYSGFYMAYEYSGMAFLYKTELIDVTNTYKILTGYSRELPRAPFVAELTINDEEYVIINNHYKCCGDGTLDDDDNWDEETRRYDASVLIKNYIDNNLSDKKVILLGDLNDELTDNEYNNVFQPFFNDADNYVFTDMYIAQSASSDWSYPSWPSHLDHIMITSEINAELTNELYIAQTIKPDEVMSGGFSTYDANVSDHRPVGLRMPLPKANGITSVIGVEGFQLIPNPAKFEVRIVSSTSALLQKIRIVDVSGREVYASNMSEIDTATIDLSAFQSGLYIVNVHNKQGEEFTQKLIVE